MRKGARQDADSLTLRKPSGNWLGNLTNIPPTYIMIKLIGKITISYLDGVDHFCFNWEIIETYIGNVVLLYG
jgi:hypothetical protein